MIPQFCNIVFIYSCERSTRLDSGINAILTTLTISSGTSATAVGTTIIKTFSKANSVYAKLFLIEEGITSGEIVNQGTDRRQQTSPKGEKPSRQGYEVFVVTAPLTDFQRNYPEFCLGTHVCGGYPVDNLVRRWLRCELYRDRCNDIEELGALFPQSL